METNIQNIACLSKIISICNKHTLATFEAQFIKKFSNTEVELKKCVAYIKKRVLLQFKIVRGKPFCNFAPSELVILFGPK